MVPVLSSVISEARWSNVDGGLYLPMQYTSYELQHTMVPMPPTIISCPKYPLPVNITIFASSELFPVVLGILAVTGCVYNPRSFFEFLCSTQSLVTSSYLVSIYKLPPDHVDQKVHSFSRCSFERAVANRFVAPRYQGQNKPA